MQFREGRLVVSPTDLVAFVRCPHLAERRLALALGELAEPSPPDELSALVVSKAAEHERRYLEALAASGASLVEVPTEADDEARLALTRKALAEGADVVFQAGLSIPGEELSWIGFADVLRRVEAVSGEACYVPEDAKLARTVTPEAVLQLGCYALGLEAAGFCSPPEVAVVLAGADGFRRVPIAWEDVGAYVRRTKARFEHAVASRLARRFERDLPIPEDFETKPEPVASCSVCPWKPACEDTWRRTDHLCQIPSLRRDQAKRLEQAGVTTVAALARSQGRVARIGGETLERLRRQARLVCRAREDPSRPVPYELLEASEKPGRGLGALPPPDPGDLFFDIEGDPLVEGGLEYCFGLHWVGEDGRANYRAFFAHTRDEERRAFEAVVDEIWARLAAHPHAHVYHYAPYERAALGRLMGRHATREDEVDELFRRHKLVDLYQVVRQGVLLGLPSLSLKQLEACFGRARRLGEVVDAAGSVVFYERWLSSGDPALLEAIERYNEQDCVSLRELRDWLEGLREEYAARTHTALPRPQPVVPDGTDHDGEDETSAGDEARLRARAASLARRCVELAERVRASGGAFGETAALAYEVAGALELLASLLGFHLREDKPAWWRYFERLSSYEPEDFLEDPECLGGITFEREGGREKRSTLVHYRFPPGQECKLRPGDQVEDPEVAAASRERGERVRGPGTLRALDLVEGTLVLSRGAQTRTAPHPKALIPSPPPPTGPLRTRLCELAEAFLGELDPVLGAEPAGPGEPPFGELLEKLPCRAVFDLLMAAPPRFSPLSPTPSPITRSESGEGRTPREPSEGGEALAGLVAGLDRSVLAVQGPPGSGKTTSAAAVVVGLVAAGRRVGVAANSHAVVRHLLEAILAEASSRNVDLTVAQRAQRDEALVHERVRVTDKAEDVAALVAGGSVQVAAGTAWLFAKLPREGLDVVLVDEASQVPLANACVIGSAARSLVLVGDPCQLPQPTEGHHPEGSDVSGLSHLLRGRATVEPGRGVFLETTHRLHPSLCAFVSGLSYEGRLKPAPSTATHELRPRRDHGAAVTGEGRAWRLPRAGLAFVPVDHEANRTASLEEAEVVAELVGELLSADLAPPGEDRPFSERDVLVVAPYNAQVRAVREALRDAGYPEVEVGTVDRFQGREAAVVLVTLAASSPEELARGLPFLFAKERLNVAVSRAKALCVLVCSEKLAEVRCESVEELRLANGLCRFLEEATVLTRPAR